MSEAETFFKVVIGHSQINKVYLNHSAFKCIIWMNKQLKQIQDFF